MARHCDDRGVGSGCGVVAAQHQPSSTGDSPRRGSRQRSLPRDEAARTRDTLGIGVNELLIVTVASHRDVKNYPNLFAPLPRYRRRMPGTARGCR